MLLKIPLELFARARTSCGLKLFFRWPAVVLDSSTQLFGYAPRLGTIYRPPQHQTGGMVSDSDVPSQAPGNLQTLSRGAPAQFIQTPINQGVTGRGAKPLSYYAFFDVHELTRVTSLDSARLD